MVTRMIEFDGETLTIELKNSGNLIGTLTIKKISSGYFHYFSWSTGGSPEILPKPIGDYPRDNKNSGFSWLLDVYGRAVKVRPDAKEFREKIWRPLIEELQKSREYQRFKEEAVTPEINELKRIIKRLIIYKKEGKDESFPVDLEVEFQGKRKTLRLTSSSVRDPNKVIDAFLKEYGEFPDELDDISRKDWSREIINKLKKEKKLKFKKIEESEEGLMKETVLNFLRNARIVLSKDEALIDETAVFFDRGSLVVPSKTIRSCLLSNGYNNFSWQRLRDILNPFIKKNTGTVRFDNRTILRCWYFDPKKIGIDVKKAIEGEKDEFNG